MDDDEPPSASNTVCEGPDGAELHLAEVRTGCFVLNYVPPPGVVVHAGLLTSENWARLRGVELLRFDCALDILEISPRNTIRDTSRYLGNKHPGLQSITLDGFDLTSWFGSAPYHIDEVIEGLDRLPGALIRDPFHGLGFRKKYLPLLTAVQQACSRTATSRSPGITLRVVPESTSPALPNADEYEISATLLEEERLAIDRIHERALKVAAAEKKLRSYNSLVYAAAPQYFPFKPDPYHEDTLRRAIAGGDLRRRQLSREVDRAVVGAAPAAARAMARHDRPALFSLAREVEVVTLETALDEFRTEIDRGHDEPWWQAKLRERPFLLQLTSGVPATVFGDEVRVGSAGFDGRGGKIADFALKSTATGNLSLVEIKKPKTPLLEAKPYRARLHRASNDLVGAVSQVLDQRHQLLQDLSSLKNRSRIYDIEGYAVEALVIVGRTPQDQDEQKSLELFRRELRTVTVLTFDEVIDKLEIVLTVLKDGKPDEPV